MKIDPTNNLGPVATPASSATTRPDEVRNAAKPSNQGIEPADSKDQIQLSNLLDRLKQANANQQSDNEVTPEQAARLDRLTAAIDAGTYEVDAQKLSSKIVDDHLRGIG